MTTTTHERMHADHREWRGEIADWLEEANSRSIDLEKMKTELSDAATELEREAFTLLQQIREWSEVQQRIAAHEVAIADYESGGSDEALIEMAEQHRSQEQQHVGRRDARNNLKRRHAEIIARWRRFQKALALRPNIAAATSSESVEKQ